LEAAASAQASAHTRFGVTSRRDLPSSAAFAKATASHGLPHGKQVDGVPHAVLRNWFSGR